MKNLNNEESLVESLLLASDEPLSISKICGLTGLEKATAVDILQSLATEYLDSNRGIQLREVAGGYRFYTHPAHHETILSLIEGSKKRKLTQAALETLAIVAYKQPVTKASVSEIRGVNVDGVITSLLDKDLIEEAGREDGPGQPILYRTTKYFLQSMGINSIKDLPPAEQFEPDEETKFQIALSLSNQS